MLIIFNIKLMLWYSIDALATIYLYRVFVLIFFFLFITWWSYTTSFPATLSLFGHLLFQGLLTVLLLTSNSAQQKWCHSHSTNYYIPVDDSSTSCDIKNIKHILWYFNSSFSMLLFFWLTLSCPVHVQYVHMVPDIHISPLTGFNCRLLHHIVHVNIFFNIYFCIILNTYFITDYFTTIYYVTFILP